MSILAQVEQVAKELPGLYTYGPLGVFSAFFMLVSLKLLSLGVKLITAVKEDGAELRKDMKAMMHRTAGLERAIWADLLERDSVSVHVKSFARKAIAKIDNEYGLP